MAQQRRFQDQVVWITGASAGIGEATARAFAQEGARLILSARREDELQRVRQSLGLGEERARVLPLDLADLEALPEKAQQALALFGHVDVMVHNGGISQRSLAIDTKLEVDQRLMQVNYFGTVALTKALLPSMIARGRGHFVVVTSLVGIIGSPLRTAYSASKHALHGFFESLRAEVAKQGIAVTLVAPGFVRTEVSRNALTGEGARYGKVDEKIAQGIAPEACARAIVEATAERRVLVTPGGFERVGAYVQRLSPWFFSRLITRMKVT